MTRTPIHHHAIRLISRRHALCAGALGSVGLSLPRLMRGENENPGARAKSCILFFLEGGPSHIDLWDMKPEAPAEVRRSWASSTAPTRPSPLRVFVVERLSGGFANVWWVVSGTTPR